VTSFRIGEAAELLGVSADTMRRWVDAGRLAATAVVKDSVMAQVDIQAGPFRIVSLMSREAVDELDLQVGSLAVAVIKSTTVVVERDPHSLLPARGGVSREA
jgi:molybdopterin-binding protein